MHYNLQLSIYMYMIIKHNPNLKPGKLTIHHIMFEEEEEKDKYGYPITKLDSNGDPIVKEIVQYDLPYLKDEVVSILSWYKENATMLQKEKEIMVKLFDIHEGAIVPSDHCYTLKFLKDIIDQYPDDHMQIFLYLFYMTCPNPDMNPFLM